MHPLRISAAAAVGRSRQGRLNTCGGPSQSKDRNADAAAIASEPIRMHSRSKTVDKQITIQDTRMAIAPYGDRRCSSHLSHHQVKCTRKHNHTASPSPQFAIPQRGRKRLSREATLHAVLALEWPELVQIGRCKVQWPPTDLNKQILTSFWKYKTITQHHPATDEGTIGSSARITSRVAKDRTRYYASRAVDSFKAPMSRVFLRMSVDVRDLT